MFYRKKLFLKLSKISQEKTCVGVYIFLITLQALMPTNLLKRDPNTGVCLRNLRNFSENLFGRISANDCFHSELCGVSFNYQTKIWKETSIFCAVFWFLKQSFVNILQSRYCKKSIKFRLCWRLFFIKSPSVKFEKVLRTLFFTENFQLLLNMSVLQRFQHNCSWKWSFCFQWR